MKHGATKIMQAGRRIALIPVVCALLLLAAEAQAQSTPGAILANPAPGFFDLATPGRFSLTVFGGAFDSDKYKTLQEGFQFNQSLTRYVGIVGRASGYQLFVGHGYQNPLIPTAGSSARYNFGRFQGGVDLTLAPLTHLFLLGGADAGDSHRANIEGDFASWLFVHSMMPLNVMFTAIHDYQNGVTSSSIDLRTVVLSRELYMVMAGAGGSIYGGGFISDIAGQGGPDLSVYYRPWRLGIDGQMGYGTANLYGQLVIYKQFSWVE
jgi:hypothetical protein